MVWAWCLMPNHVHLILVPVPADGLRPGARRRCIGTTARSVNGAKDWSGHLWQSRFASVPMDEAHLHACLRYVELNPVRAGLVERPEQWRWSSARAHLGLGRRRSLTEPGRRARARIDDWRALLDARTRATRERDAIRARERSGRPLGAVPGTGEDRNGDRYASPVPRMKPKGCTDRGSFQIQAIGSPRE